MLFRQLHKPTGMLLERSHVAGKGGRNCTRKKVRIGHGIRPLEATSQAQRSIHILRSLVGISEMPQREGPVRHGSNANVVAVFDGQEPVRLRLVQCERLVGVRLRRLEPPHRIQHHGHILVGDAQQMDIAQTLRDAQALRRKFKPLLMLTVKKICGV